MQKDYHLRLVHRPMAQEHSTASNKQSSDRGDGRGD